MIPTKKYLVMVDYDCEGWRIHQQADTIIEAVAAREEAIAGYCVPAMIVINIGTLEAYRQAAEEEPDRKPQGTDFSDPC
jgi:aerobic-type carbon monoxide dehydrogenase small subunit (CoxS/CutS family)